MKHIMHYNNISYDRILSHRTIFKTIHISNSLFPCTEIEVGCTISTGNSNSSYLLIYATAYISAIW